MTSGQYKSFAEIHSEEMARINAVRNSIKSEISPDNLADLIVQLSSWKGWLGEKMVEAKMEYNRIRNNYRVNFRLSAAAAQIKAESTPHYHDALFLDQLYKDCQGLISAAKTKLEVMRNDRF